MIARNECWHAGAPEPFKRQDGPIIDNQWMCPIHHGERVRAVAFGRTAEEATATARVISDLPWLLGLYDDYRNAP